MVEQHQPPRRGRVLGGVRPTGEDHRTNTFELFFDLAGLAGLVLILAALIVVETTRYAQTRRHLRGA